MKPNYEHCLQIRPRSDGLFYFRWIGDTWHPSVDDEEMVTYIEWLDKYKTINFSRVLYYE